MAIMNRMQRWASAAVIRYLRGFPVERGKWRLMQLAKSFLVVELEPGLFLRVPEISYVGREIVRQGLFEPETVSAFLALIEPGMTVLDVGANVGQYTLLAARRVGDRGRVHAFEPTPAMATTLRRSVALNRLDNVVVSQVAVSDTPGEATLYFQEDAGENTLLKTDACGASVTVLTVTLDDYVVQHGLSSVDVIKMDIEGAELLALRGARKLLSGDSAPVLVLEVNPRTLAFSGSSADELLELLREFGYDFFPIADYGTETAIPWSNVIAAKPAHLERFSALRQWQRDAVPV